MNAGSQTGRYQRGHSAETLACWFLRLKAYHVVHRRWRSPFGEIDIIARRGSTYVFVEVKHRNTRAKGLEAISPSQQERIVNAASHYMSNRRGNMRFDCIVMTPGKWPLHVVNAWGSR